MKQNSGPGRLSAAAQIAALAFMMFSVLLPPALAAASTPGVCDFYVIVRAVPGAAGTPQVTVDPSTLTTTENGANVCWTFDNRTPDQDLVASAHADSSANRWATDTFGDQGSSATIYFVGPEEFEYVANVGHWTGLPGARTYEPVAYADGTLCIGCSTTTSTSAQPSGGGGVPEFPPQLGTALLFTALLVGPYLLARRVSPNGSRP